MNPYRKAADALAIVVLLWAIAMLIAFAPRFANFTSIHEEAVAAFQNAPTVTNELKTKVIGLWNAEAASNGLLVISWSGFAAAELIQVVLAFIARQKEKQNA
jgi:hypothetical protein